MLAGEEKEVKVTCRASDERVERALWRLSISQHPEYETSVLLIRQVPDAVAALDPAMLNFGPTLIRNATEREIRIHNREDTPVRFRISESVDKTALFQRRTFSRDVR